MSNSNFLSEHLLNPDEDLFTTPNNFSYQQVYYVVFVYLLLNNSFQVRTRTVATDKGLGATLNLVTQYYYFIQSRSVLSKKKGVWEVLASEESKA